jgi:hypothetical protein
MKEFHPDPLEAELRRLKPAPPPPSFLDRLAKAGTEAARPSRPEPRPERDPGRWAWQWLRWLAPLGAAAALAVLLLARPGAPPQPQVAHQSAPAPKLEADDVRFESELLTSFDAVARLPDGLPVRFRCREWVDEVTLRDTARGVEIQQRTPRLEIVPVRFETY